jgi:hypothetical protein
VPRQSHHAYTIAHGLTCSSPRAAALGDVAPTRDAAGEIGRGEIVALTLLELSARVDMPVRDWI